MSVFERRFAAEMSGVVFKPGMRFLRTAPAVPDSILAFRRSPKYHLNLVKTAVVSQNLIGGFMSSERGLEYLTTTLLLRSSYAIV